MNTLIENENQYNTALEIIEELMDLSPDPDSAEGRKLHYFILLVKNYEKDLEINELPDPIEAIKFRMEQQNLKARDLIPIIGNRSKVSEVLSGKRPLSLEMIRALSSNLQIPAKVLIQETQVALTNDTIDFDKIPVKEIVKRKWFDFKTDSAKVSGEMIWDRMSNINPNISQFAAMYRKQAINFRSGRKMDDYALYFWNLRIISQAREVKTTNKYDARNLNDNVFKNLVQLSVFEDGPIRAIEFLKNFGIKVIIEPHFPKTYLDGAVILADDQAPIIGMTLRFDRTDNFWFTLMHEIAHIYLHSTQNIETFYDDLEIVDDTNKLEREADEFARNTMIPLEEWELSTAKVTKFQEAAISLAKKLMINPAIVAGRMRYESKAYRLLNNLVGNKEVRKLFPNIKWS